MANQTYFLHHGQHFDVNALAHLEYLHTEKEKWRQERRGSVPGSWEWLRADERVTAYSDAYMHAFRKLSKEHKDNQKNESRKNG